MRQIENARLLLSASFTAKFELAFVLTQKNALSERFHFTANRKSIGSSKKWQQGFSKQTSVFQYFNLEINFLKNKNLFQKIRLKTQYLYTKLPCRKPILRNRMGSTKLTYHKELSFVSNYLISLKTLFYYMNLLESIDLTYQPPKCSYSYFSFMGQCDEYSYVEVRSLFFLKNSRVTKEFQNLFKRQTNDVWRSSTREMYENVKKIHCKLKRNYLDNAFKVALSHFRKFFPN